jgi:prephenate dehydratase
MIALSIAHLGTSGSFSEEAALAWAREFEAVPELVSGETPAAVLALLARGAAERAVLPLANSSAGLVRPAVAALARGGFELEGELVLPVRLVLWVRDARVTAARITRVASHPQALAQCARTLARLMPGHTTLPWSDTASAARALAEGRLDEHTAVVASARAGALHELAALARDVHDQPDNRTFFAVFRRAGQPAVD